MQQRRPGDLLRYEQSRELLHEVELVISAARFLFFLVWSVLLMARKPFGLLLKGRASFVSAEKQEGRGQTVGEAP